MSVSDQKSIAARFGALYVPVKPDEKAGVAIHTLSSLPLNALRHPPENGTSGWYVWGGERLSEDSTFFKPLHHKHLAQHCPNLVPYLGLAPGWRVLLAPNQEEVWFDEKLLTV
jgi:hypothetical protein